LKYVLNLQAGENGWERIEVRRWESSSSSSSTNFIATQVLKQNFRDAKREKRGFSRKRGREREEK